MKSKICNTHNGKLIGYVYLVTIKLNCAILWKVTKVESHVLISLIVNYFEWMHCHLIPDDNKSPETDITYCMRNLFNGTENIFFYFLSDVSHLSETARNFLLHSGSGKCTRYMWNGGIYFLWNYIADIFYGEEECRLHLLPKLNRWK